MNYPKVSIIILNWRSPLETIKCLKNLEKVFYPNFEIIVVDNGSKDKSAQILKKYLKNYKKPAFFIQNKENLGYGEGNNIAIRQALKDKASYLLVLNNDTLVNPDFLNKMIEFAKRDKKIGILSPKIRVIEEKDKIWYAGGKINWWLSKGENITDSKTTKPMKTDFATGCAMLIKKEVFEKIGLLSPDYFLYYEDTDFSLRAKKAGFKVYYLPKSQIFHKKTDLDSPTLVYYWNRNRFLFMKKFAPPVFLILAFLLLFIRILRHFFAFLFKRDEKSRLILKASLDALVGKKGKGVF